MIIADENIDHSLIAAIREAGIDVYSVYESQRGLRDEDVIASSRNPPRIILTEDKDFGEWVFAHNITDIRVLFLRYHFRETAAMQTVLINLLTERLDSLLAHFTTVTVHKIRSRRIN